jgi:hypothetical protein
MRQLLLSDEQIEGEVEPILKSVRPWPLLRLYLMNWAALGAVIGIGSVLASDKPWSAFEPSARWLMVVALGSGIAALSSPITRLWALRRYLTRTNAELRAQLEKDWSTLTGAGWQGRVIRFSVAASIFFGGVNGTLFSLLFPADRLFGSTLGTIGVMISAFLVSILPMAFGFRALFVRQLKRRVGPGGALPKEIP